MPRYMDRHNIPSASSADLAEAHALDLTVQSQFDTRFLTYWFDPDDGTGICLVEAPDMHAIEQVHRAAHGNVPTEIIEVDVDMVQAFLGRVTDPAPVALESGESRFGRPGSSVCRCATGRLRWAQRSLTRHAAAHPGRAQCRSPGRAQR